MTQPGLDSTAPQATLGGLFSAFLKVGVTSFGGSSQAWMHRELVERRKWLDDEQFLTGLAIAQVLPGANPVNLALYLGMQLRGGRGAIVGVVAMVAPAFGIILALAFAYRQLAGIPLLHFLLAGVAAVGVGATLSVGVKVAAKLPRRAGPVLIALGTFVAVGVLRAPMIAVVAVVVPLSVAAAYFSPAQEP